MELFQCLQWDWSTRECPVLSAMGASSSKFWVNRQASQINSSFDVSFHSMFVSCIHGCLMGGHVVANLLRLWRRFNRRRPKSWSRTGMNQQLTRTHMFKGSLPVKSTSTVKKCWEKPTDAVVSKIYWSSTQTRQPTTVLPTSSNA